MARVFIARGGGSCFGVDFSIEGVSLLKLLGETFGGEGVKLKELLEVMIGVKAIEGLM